MSKVLPPAKDKDAESQRLIDEYLNKGGTVTKCPPYQRSESIEYSGNFYTRRKLKKEDEENEQ